MGSKSCFIFLLIFIAQILASKTKHFSSNYENSLRIESPDQVQVIVKAKDSSDTYKFPIYDLKGTYFLKSNLTNCLNLDNDTYGRTQIIFSMFGCVPVSFSDNSTKFVNSYFQQDFTRQPLINSETSNDFAFDENDESCDFEKMFNVTCNALDLSNFTRFDIGYLKIPKFISIFHRKFFSKRKLILFFS